MRIATTSDIHIDINGQGVLDALCARFRAVSPDVIVIAGDIATGATTYLTTLLALKACAPHLLVVAGNHDVWTSPAAVAQGMDSWAWLDKLLPALAAEAGAHLLDAGPVVIGGVGFAGTLGWYDLTMREHVLDAPMDAYRSGRFGGLMWNDHRFAHFRGDDGQNLPCEVIAARLLDRFSTHLDGLQTSRVVVATHMLGWDRQIHRKDRPGWRFVNAFMGSLRLGERIARDARVELAIAGHTHLHSDLRIGRLRALVSPLGYAKEWRAPDVAGAVERSVAVVDL